MANLNSIRNINLTDQCIDSRVIDSTDTFSVSGMYIVSATVEAITATDAYIETLDVKNFSSTGTGAFVFDARFLTNQSTSIYDGIVKGDNNATNTELAVTAMTGTFVSIDQGALVYDSVYKTYPQITLHLDPAIANKIDVVCLDNLNSTDSVFITNIVSGPDGVVNQIPEVPSSYYPLAVITRSLSDILSGDIVDVRNYIKNGADEGSLTTTVSCSAYIPLPTSTTKTILSVDINDTTSTIAVVNTDGFLDYGVLKIGNEYIQYSGKTRSSFINCVRAYDGSSNVSHTVFDEVYKSFEADQCTWTVTPQIMGDTSLSWGIPVGHTYDVGYWMFNFKCWSTVNRQVFFGYDTSFHQFRSVDSVVGVWIRGTELA